ncbi:SDR family oxidoreductase [Ornithinimicrobium humiphilum]|uniref:NAD(P)-dependent dehydrogenase (Short-subunit alcohol dehydrogenase family) n=1 Tax=Ornithinimicrobium humiphilum TaxID=125288 RepID=A0A543KMB0_9MICO|nr:glucose 1-dehydrogenase [Ornithinimicrobium humiphilum]TQM96215.1 NAD(P)-dependent dehydrogenase (short-subunit alcohol dehydrogenase family) [Ornithinimicrobium humiphilum]
MAVSAGGRLNGKVVLVTGAARGLGAAIATAAAVEGAHVMVTDLDAAGAEAVVRQLGSEGLSARATMLDVTDQDSVDAAVRATEDWHGRIDGLVNNAGLLIEADVVSLTEAQWDTVMDVNLKGAWRMTKAVVPVMLEVGSGSIVNISSLEGHFARPGHVAYAVSKAALLNLTRATAVDFGREGIRCNAICPGSVETDLLAQHFAATGDPEAAASDIIGRNRVGRLGRPEEIGATAVFFLSDEVGYLNGSYLIVDGGRGATT